MEQCEAEKAEPQLKAGAQCAEMVVEDLIIFAHNDPIEQGHLQVRSVVMLAFHERKPRKYLGVETAEVLVGCQGKSGVHKRIAVIGPCSRLKSCLTTSVRQVDTAGPYG